MEIVDTYIDRGERVFFCRVPKTDHPVYKMFGRSGILARCGGETHFVKNVGEALRLAERADEGEEFEFYRDHDEGGAT